MLQLARQGRIRTPEEAESGEFPSPSNTFVPLSLFTVRIRASSSPYELEHVGGMGVNPKGAIKILRGLASPSPSLCD